MLYLNIIPDELKKEIKQKIFYINLKNYFYILIIILTLYSILFTVGKFILLTHFTNTVNQSSFIIKKTEDKTSKIRTLNGQISYVEKIQNEYLAWTNLLNYIGNNISNGVKLSQLRVNNKDNTIFLAGFADTRDNLLLFKSNLESSPYFSDLNFPLKNLLEKNNISFEINAKIKSYEFEPL